MRWPSITLKVSPLQGCVPHVKWQTIRQPFLFSVTHLFAKIFRPLQQRTVTAVTFLSLVFYLSAEKGLWLSSFPLPRVVP